LKTRTPFQSLYQSGNSINTVYAVVIQANQQVKYRSNNITLNKGFDVQTGADFNVSIGGCN